MFYIPGYVTQSIKLRFKTLRACIYMYNVEEKLIIVKTLEFSNF